MCYEISTETSFSVTNSHSPPSEERYFRPLIVFVDVLALSLVELYDILTGLPLNLLRSLWMASLHIHDTTHLGVADKLDAEALDLIVHVTNKDVKPNRFPHHLLRITICHSSPLEHQAADCNSSQLPPMAPQLNRM